MALLRILLSVFGVSGIIAAFLVIPSRFSEVATEFAPLPSLGPVSSYNGAQWFPPDVYEPVLEAARAKSDSRYARAGSYGLVAEVLEWTAFIITSIITLIAGWFGISLRNQEDPAAVSEDLIKKVKRRHKWLASVIGVLGALAMVTNAAGDRCESKSQSLKLEAKSVFDQMKALKADFRKANDEGEAQDALDGLKGLMNK